MNSVKNGVEIVYKKQDQRLFRTKASEIIRGVEYDDLCKGGVGPSYVKEVVRQADILILAYDVFASGVRGELRGFTIVDFKDDWLYIDVICRGKYNKPMNYRGKQTSAPGRTMIEIVGTIARSMKKKGIILSALRPVVKYYEYLGFRVADREISSGADHCTGRRGPNRAASRTARASEFYKTGSGLANMIEKKKMVKKLQNNSGVTMAKCL